LRKRDSGHAAFLFLNVANFGLRDAGTACGCDSPDAAGGLTLTPALMSVMGGKLFWPFSQEHGALSMDSASPGGRCQRQRRVGRSGCGCRLLIPYLFLPRMVRSFDVLADVPSDMDSAKGFSTLKAF